MISSAVCLLRRAVLAFRRWLQEKAGGDVGWAGGATSKDLPAKLSRKEVLNRWDRHGKNCADCTQVNCQCYFWGVDGPMTPLLHPSSAGGLYTCPPPPPHPPSQIHSQLPYSLVYMSLVAALSAAMCTLPKSSCIYYRSFLTG